MLNVRRKFDRDARNGLFAQIQCTELEGKRHRPLAATYTAGNSVLPLDAMAASPSLLDSILGSRLCADWSAVAQYAFGWCVPFLTLGLLYLRWESRPAAQPLRGFPRKIFVTGSYWFSCFIFRSAWSKKLTRMAASSLGSSSLAGGALDDRSSAGRWPAVGAPFCICCVLYSGRLPWPSAWESCLFRRLPEGVPSLRLKP